MWFFLEYFEIIVSLVNSFEGYYNIPESYNSSFITLITKILNTNPIVQSKLLPHKISHIEHIDDASFSSMFHVALLF